MNRFSSLKALKHALVLIICKRAELKELRAGKEIAWSWLCPFGKKQKQERGKGGTTCEGKGKGSL
jgi:hypothetical protein